MLKTSETLLIGFDSSGKKDSSVLTVLRKDGTMLQEVGNFSGKEAEELYKKLTGK